MYSAPKSNSAFHSSGVC